MNSRIPVRPESGHTAAVEAIASPRERTFTIGEYHKLASLGVLREDDRVELLNGRIYTMTPIGSRHAECVRRLTEILIFKVAPKVRVSVQNPIRLNNHSEPEPDFALLVPKDVYFGRHPRPDEVLLVIEVADTTLDFDLDVKTPLYARAGIREVWVIALDEQRVHVYRRPGADGYTEHSVLQSGDSLEVGAFPDAGAFAVDAMLG